MGIERVREAVLERARKEAEKIIEDAKRKAEEIVSKARRDYEIRVRRKKEEIVSKIISEESIKYIRKVVELNVRLTNVKNEVLNNLLEGIKVRLRECSDDVRRKSLRKLLSEVLESGVIPSNIKIVIKVTKKDLRIIKDVLKELNIEDRVLRIDTLGDDFLGGVIVESEDGVLAIDNTYKARLEKLLPILTKALHDKVLR